MRMTIRVSNLVPSTNQSDLQQLCSPHGRVRKIRLVTNVAEINSVIAMVEMQSEEQCQAAMAALDGIQHRGRALTVRRETSHKGADAAHLGMSAPARVTREQKLGTSDGPSAGGFGDRSGKGRRGGQFYL
jgi:RNA recognition motif-containing protein